MLKETAREEIKNIVISRLESLNKNSKILLLGFNKPLSVTELLDEVKKDSVFGKKIVEVQFEFLKMLTSGVL